MKKLLFIFSTAILFLTLTACNADTDTTESPEIENPKLDDYNKEERYEIAKKELEIYNDERYQEAKKELEYYDTEDERRERQKDLNNLLRLTNLTLIR